MAPEAGGVCTRCGNTSKRIRRGLCYPCYSRDRAGPRQMKPYAPRIPDIKARLTAKVQINDAGCWIYTGTPNPQNGYMQIVVDRRSCYVHRIAYEIFVGPIPDGLEIDHRCHSDDATCLGGRTCPHRACCNPAHLEPVTTMENNRRSKSPTAKNAAKTHCSRGHEYTAENTIIVTRRTSTGTGQRRKCRECERLWKRTSNERLDARPVRPPVKNPVPLEDLPTHCPHGHEYTPENTNMRQNRHTLGTHRECRACAKASATRYRDRKQAGASMKNGD